MTLGINRQVAFISIRDPCPHLQLPTTLIPGARLAQRTAIRTTPFHAKQSLFFFFPAMGPCVDQKLAEA